MTTIILRQNLGNTQPRSTNVAVKGSPLHDYEVDNNFNNLNNDISTRLVNSNTPLNPIPSLDLDFTNTTTLDPKITFKIGRAHV